MGFWNAVELLLDIVFFGGIGIFLIMLIAGAVLTHRDKKNGVPSEPTYSGPPQMVEKRCPHCGGNASKFYTPGKDKYPTMFTCSDCYRSFGDTYQMSEEEREIVAEQEEVCQRVENMVCLQSVLQDVHALVKRKSSFVSIENGHIWQWKGTEKTLVRHYPPNLGKVGDQHLAFLCMQYSMQQVGYLGIKMWLMDHGLAWEWPK